MNRRSRRRDKLGPLNLARRYQAVPQVVEAPTSGHWEVADEDGSSADGR